MTGPNLANRDKPLYQFIRGSVGLGFQEFSFKFYYDHNFDDNGYKLGLLMGVYVVRHSYTPPPPPLPSPPPSSPPPSPPPEIPRVKIVNNTGYTGFYLFVFPVSQENWGGDVLGEDVLLKRDSVNIRLAYQLNAVNKYTIIMFDEDDDMYIKPNVLLSSNNQTVTFTLDDLYVPPREDHPTIRSEELNRVELAYAETVRFIQQRGKRLYIRNLSERNTFIRQYQGIPETGAVRAARDKKLEWYDIRTTSQEDIVALAKRESNAFVKVRMIHDWVSDVFFYDYDLLQWMKNVSGRNEEFTLGKIIERQRGVCFEYAVLFWFLLDAVGIDTYLISDHSEPEIGHAYNMVLINNTGYIIDTTWDSGNKYESGKIIEFKRMKSKDFFMPNISQSYQLRNW
jgi:hypothetical protein